MYVYIYIQFLTFSRSHARTIMLSFFFVDYFFCYHYAFVFTLSHHRIRFSLLKATNAYHYALTFFSFHIFFFLSLSHFFNNIFLIIISVCSHFFFHLVLFFLSLNNIIQQYFFYYALIMLSRINLFYFQFFHFCLRGDPYRYFIFATFPTSTSTFSNHL